MESFKIGDIVSSNQHPYFETYQKSIISGEHLMTPPMMVVVEVLLILKNEHSEESGEKILEEGMANCKCIWFSSKTYQFEDHWFYSNQLKHIKEKKRNSDEIELKVGATVSLKTIKLELKKKKSSLSVEHSYNESKDKKSITSLLSFVSPVMQVLQIKKTESKEIKFDMKSGKQKRFYPKTEVKCKWFNPSADKFTEKFLPLEVLLVLPMIGNKKIDEINMVIYNRGILVTEQTLFRPSAIYFRSGFYLLSGFDFIKNKSIDIPISDDFVVKTEKDLYVKIAPDFKLIPSHRGKEWSEKSSIDSLLKDSVSNRYFTTIKYKNREEKLTTRTVSDIKLHSTLERLETATETTLVEVLYLEAYCHLRETIRYFKVDRVISIKQLNLKYKIL
jgi:hypothetical protein